MEILKEDAYIKRCKTIKKLFFLVRFCPIWVAAQKQHAQKTTICFACSLMDIMDINVELNLHLSEITSGSSLLTFTI